MRSRAVSFPCLWSFSIFSGPPPSATRARRRRNSSSRSRVVEGAFAFVSSKGSLRMAGVRAVAARAAQR